MRAHLWWLPLPAAFLLVMLVAVPSGAAFSARTRSQASWAANPYFSCANAIAAWSPSVWYRMDETSSTATSATDSSGNARTGVYSSAGRTAGQLRACTGDSGTAMLFDGSSGYLSSPQVAGAAPNTFTVSIWFKTTSTSGGKLIGYGTSQTATSGEYDRHLYLTNSGKLTFGAYPNAYRTVQTTATYRDGLWHQAVGTLSSAGMSLYVDGQPIATDATTTSGQTLTNGYWRVAYDNLDTWRDAPTSRYFAGTLDDAAVLSTALTADQVKALYLAGAANVPVAVATAPTGGPVAGNYQVMDYWNLVLDTLNGVTPAGSPLISAAVTSTGSQVWRLQPMSDNSYKIVNLATGRIVGIEGGSTASGAAAVMVEDKSSQDALWKITARGNGYTVVNVNSGLSLVVPDDSGFPDTRLIQQTEAAQRTLIWRFNPR